LRAVFFNIRTYVVHGKRVLCLTSLIMRVQSSSKDIWGPFCERTCNTGVFLRGQFLNRFCAYGKKFAPTEKVAVRMRQLSQAPPLRMRQLSQAPPLHMRQLSQVPTLRMRLLAPRHTFMPRREFTPRSSLKKLPSEPRIIYL
jgi:hypothetical protein